MDDPTAVLSRLLDIEVERQLAWLAACPERWLQGRECLPHELAALAGRQCQPAAAR